MDEHTFDPYAEFREMKRLSLDQAYEAMTEKEKENLTLALQTLDYFMKTRFDFLGDPELFQALKIYLICITKVKSTENFILDGKRALENMVVFIAHFADELKTPTCENILMTSGGNACRIVYPATDIQDRHFKNFGTIPGISENAFYQITNNDLKMAPKLN